MTLQAAVDFKEYFRCYVVGQDKVHIMPYDPRAPFHERYLTNPPAYDRALLDRVELDARALCRALGYDLNTVEFAVEDGIPYAIDFMNPAPDADVHSVGASNFDWIVEAVAELAVRKALEPLAAGRTALVPVLEWSIRAALTRPSFTLGIEEEYQTVDPATFDLRSHIGTELIANGKRLLAEKVKAEMHQAVIEVGTGVCRDIAEAREDVVNLRRQMIRLAREHGLLLAAGATHPFADWRVQDIYPDERYLQVVEDMQTRRALEFDFRAARARRHRGPRNVDSSDEPDALFPAASAGALDQLAVLARHEHRAEVVSHQGVRQIPAHEHPGHVRELGGFRRASSSCSSRPIRSTTPSGSGGTSGRIRSSRHSKCGSATCRCAWTKHSPSPR